MDLAINTTAGLTRTLKTSIRRFDTSAISAMNMYANGITYASITSPIIASFILLTLLIFDLLLRIYFNICFMFFIKYVNFLKIFTTHEENKMGSVKDLTVITAPGKNNSGTGQFHFSDRYSVFDWGEMPDLLTDKGKALCIIGAFFFEKLELMGVRTHYQGVVHENKVKRLDEINIPVDTMQVSLVHIIKPRIQNDQYDYSVYSKDDKNILIPLEVIYRNSLPAGSSVFRRLKNGSLKLEDIGLENMPKPNDVLTDPILDVSTKLEVTDRYMNWNEAQQISAVSDDELKTILETTRQINSLISEQVGIAGLVNEDGKVEYAYDPQRKLMLVDILGTPDECRFTYQGMQVSKEVARTYYRNTPWYDLIEAAKEKDRANWKSLVEAPPALPPELFQLISQLYQGACNEITGKEWFDVPALKSVLEQIQEQIS